MIKGVNKQVLEINETDNSFFEKAIFFVKPEYSGYSEVRLRENAKKELSLAGAPPKPGILKNKPLLKKYAKNGALLFAGVVLGLLISLLFR